MSETFPKIVGKEMLKIYFINMAGLTIYVSNVVMLLVPDKVDARRFYPTLLFSLKTPGNLKKMGLHGGFTVRLGSVNLLWVILQIRLYESIFVKVRRATRSAANWWLRHG